MTIAALREDSQSISRAASADAPVHIGLLGCGNVGGAFAALAQTGAAGRPLRITHALVRDRLRPRPTLDPQAARTTDSAAVFATQPDVIVELVGGIEPARTLVLEALFRGIPVITANKSLLAAHGPELREAATRTSTPLLFEAAVIAGVPFVGTFLRRPHASDVTSLAGIVNGTSNYILTSARDERCAINAALADAQRLGYAEPDPSNDVDGVDAAEKLVVLLQLLARAHVRTHALEIEGIATISSPDIDLASALGGTIKAVISADWSGDLDAFVGPAFVPQSHPLAHVDGVENALILNGRRGRLVFRGPGAGPDVTAATVMDDVIEAVSGRTAPTFPPLDETDPAAPATSWYVTAASGALPSGSEISDLFAAHGVHLKRTVTRGSHTFAALSWPVTRERIDLAVRALAAAGRCEVKCLRALEDE